ncbi:hypothetical protein KW459_16080 [Vibrio fluvialis]|nr:hypothetical protein [Vibrio fluvialis]
MKGLAKYQTYQKKCDRLGVQPKPYDEWLALEQEAKQSKGSNDKEKHQ